MREPINPLSMTIEPEVPPGLADLSPPQRALVEFLEIDTDILGRCLGWKRQGFTKRYHTGQSSRCVAGDWR